MLNNFSTSLIHRLSFATYNGFERFWLAQWLNACHHVSPCWNFLIFFSSVIMLKIFLALLLTVQSVHGLEKHCSISNASQSQQQQLLQHSLKKNDLHLKPNQSQTNVLGRQCSFWKFITAVKCMYTMKSLCHLHQSFYSFRLHLRRELSNALDCNY